MFFDDRKHKPKLIWYSKVSLSLILKVEHFLTM
jgi:hypothetical protein